MAGAGAGAAWPCSLPERYFVTLAEQDYKDPSPPHRTMSLLQNLQAILSLLCQVCLVFPYSALTIRRQRLLPTTHSSDRTTTATMISDKVYKLCTSSESVSALLAKDPTMAPGEAWKKLYGHHAAGEKTSASTARAHRDTITPEDLQRAFECGNWGPTRPSDLFLRVRLRAMLARQKLTIRSYTTML